MPLRSGIFHLPIDMPWGFRRFNPLERQWLERVIQLTFC